MRPSGLLKIQIYVEMAALRHQYEAQELLILSDNSSFHKSSMDLPAFWGEVEKWAIYFNFYCGFHKSLFKVEGRIISCCLNQMLKISTVQRAKLPYVFELPWSFDEELSFVECSRLRFSAVLRKYKTVQLEMKINRETHKIIQCLSNLLSHHASSPLLALKTVVPTHLGPIRIEESVLTPSFLVHWAKEIFLKGLWDNIDQVNMRKSFIRSSYSIGVCRYLFVLNRRFFLHCNELFCFMTYRLNIQFIPIEIKKE
ncbi:hypothetical protein EGR_01750 [Echinococcus granulosus]|uniref:Uncharacterized protein n=1 Tax=Echinococcus granulosus TaxID=6210 RepID=W6V9G2_ECHGR|nr:hypothetical protein EGR_01750 [Echinococcus granulosus]EUB63259.1 hypothetical protein EGR_01750 [Echinococcus granulosus]